MPRTNHTQKKQHKSTLIIIVLLIALGGGAYLFFNQHDEGTANSSSQSPSQPATPVKADFDKTQYSQTDPASLWVVVNKQRPLSPATYIPNDLVMPNVSVRIPGAEQMQLRQPAAAALEQMFTDAEAAGHKLQVTTAFRGYNYQKTLYDGYVANQGQATADTQSARPGYSEHQTGLAVDIRPQSGECYLEACFGTMPEGKWLADNAYRYGFLLRYPENKTSVTGYTYEPWHFRYIGTELAAELQNKNILTLEEFFDLGSAPDYR